MNKLYRIIYCSRSTLIGSRAEREVQTRKILATTRDNNREATLSGAMAFNEGWFAQADTQRSPTLRYKNFATGQDVTAVISDLVDGLRRYSQGSRQSSAGTFAFDPALTKGTLPEAQKLLDALFRAVVDGDKLAKT